MKRENAEATCLVKSLKMQEIWGQSLAEGNLQLHTALFSSIRFGIIISVLEQGKHRTAKECKITTVIGYKTVAGRGYE